MRTATAPHQIDFPYDRDEEAQVTRREFCNFLGLTSAALFIGAAGFAGKAALDSRHTETFAPVKIEGAEGLAPGTSLNFRYPTEKDSAILVRSLDGSYHAFGQKCTHLSCLFTSIEIISAWSVPATKAHSMLRRAMYYTVRRRDHLTELNSKSVETAKSGPSEEKRAAGKNLSNAAGDQSNQTK